MIDFTEKKCGEYSPILTVTLQHWWVSANIGEHIYHRIIDRIRTIVLEHRSLIGQIGQLTSYVVCNQDIEYECISII